MAMWHGNVPPCNYSSHEGQRCWKMFLNISQLLCSRKCWTSSSLDTLFPALVGSKSSPATGQNQCNVRSPCLLYLFVRWTNSWICVCLFCHSVWFHQTFTQKPVFKNSFSFYAEALNCISSFPILVQCWGWTNSHPHIWRCLAFHRRVVCERLGKY